MADMEPTGYCWNCGKPIVKDLFCVYGNNKNKCQREYFRKQERQIKRGKRAGYGLAGSTH